MVWSGTAGLALAGMMLFGPAGWTQEPPVGTPAPGPTGAPSPSPSASPSASPAASPAPAQDPDADLIWFQEVGEKNGKPVLVFKTPFKPGTSVQIEIACFTTTVGFAIPEDGGGGFVITKKTMFLQSGMAWIFNESQKVAANGTVSYELKKVAAGVYHIAVTYKPMSQKGKIDPKFRKKIETEHTLIVFEGGFLKRAMIDDAKEAMAFSDKYHQTLKTAILANEKEIEKPMLPLLEEARKRAISTYHPGIYSTMQELSAFLHSNEKKLSGEDKTGTDFNAEVVDVIFKPMKLGCVRESAMMALNYLDELYAEGQRLATAAPENDIQDRLKLLDKMAVDLQAVMAELPKADPTSRLGSKLSTLKVYPLFASLVDLVNVIKSKKKVDVAPIPGLRAQVQEAKRQIADPNAFPAQ